MHLQASTFWALLLLGAASTTSAADCGNLDQNIVIRSHKSGLVLVADEVLNIITLQVYDRSVSQRFHFQPGVTLASFNIISNSTGLALDIIENGSLYVATLTELNDLKSQEFYINSDGAIVSGAYPDYALGVRNGDFTPGSYIVLTPHTEENIESEQFSLEFSQS
ncbi:hypothetical protein Zmor_001556 [Zophobas morio]|uniref:Uncharacterized protein n=1 Tax=Zophobas morio TaxID=2755281 RepID=A0AA38J5F6_9CUCU|nr:hypothetical protein Zmor_001556 [Zophobas morio]